MSQPPEEDLRSPAGETPPPGLTRRQVLRSAALGGAVLLAPGLLSACVEDELPVAPEPEEEGGSGGGEASGNSPFLGEIGIMAFGHPPKGWALCNGQFLPINQNQALFSLLGTTYGGNGQTTFALPDLRGRVPIHMGNGHDLGERPGVEAVTLTQAQMPVHTHSLRASTNSSGASPSPAANVLAPVNALYSASLDRIFDPTDPDIAADAKPVPVPAFASAGVGDLVPLKATTVSSVGGSQPHLNQQPYLVLSCCIALQGIFPSRN